MRPANPAVERIENNNINLDLSQSQEEAIKLESQIWQILKKYMPIGLTLLGLYGTIWLIRKNSKS
jgi:hypothetical protein